MLALAAVTVLAAAPAARAATLTVDDDHTDCPAAQFTSVQAAVDAAAAGDTVTICPGDYAEGTGAVGTNALTISKSLTLKGAGADLVKITPVSSGPAYGRIMEDAPDLRNGRGDVIAVVGTPSQPLDVSIQGVTVDGWDPQGRPVAVEAGILFLDARGSVERSRVTDVVTSEGNNAYLRDGGWRGPQPGIGIAQMTRALYSPVDGARRLWIDHTRIDRYNRIGVLIDGAQNDAAPFERSGAIDWGVITGSQIVGRTECIDYQGTGNCSRVGLLTTGPLFGQDGLRVTSGSYATVDSSLISQNLVNGEGAPTRASAENNANLALGAGVRYIDAQLTEFSGSTNLVILSQITHSNITDNAYGAMNLQADGVTPATGDPDATIFDRAGDLLKAEGNWWGLNDQAATNLGPAISPTTNPDAPENPVNGTAVTEQATGGTTSDAVDFYPYRDGNAANPDTGEHPVLPAPIPMSDAPPAVSLSAPSTAGRGDTITLTASASDDFGVKRVRFADGATTLGTATLPPYTQSVTIPYDAACNTSRSFSAVAMDSLGQTSSASSSVAITCGHGNGNGGGDDGDANGGGDDTPVPQGDTRQTPPAATPAAPSVAWGKWPVNIHRSGTVTFTPSAPAGLEQVAVYLGNRLICTMSGPPYACRVFATGADVGVQALRIVVTDARGSTAQVQRAVRVSKFRPKVRLRVKLRRVKHHRARRTIHGRLAMPKVVEKRLGCHGTVTLVVKRHGHSVLNQQVKLSKACRFSRSITAGRHRKRFKVNARFGGNAVLSTAAKTRRFS